MPLRECVGERVEHVFGEVDGNMLDIDWGLVFWMIRQLVVRRLVHNPSTNANCVLINQY